MAACSGSLPQRVGLLAEPGKPADLADKILKLYYDRSLARRLGDNARRWSSTARGR
jgi:glycosyltransferase involved in cell wall biosynthesis